MTIPSASTVLKSCEWLNEQSTEKTLHMRETRYKLKKEDNVPAIYDESIHSTQISLSSWSWMPKEAGWNLLNVGARREFQTKQVSYTTHDLQIKLTHHHRMYLFKTVCCVLYSCFLIIDPFLKFKLVYLLIESRMSWIVETAFDYIMKFV